jgi:uncharacterized protein (DUF1501 family)
MTFSRRDLLRSGAALGGLTALGGLLPIAGRGVRASELASDQHFLFCYFNGGWDLLLSLDPRDPAVFRPDLRKTTRIETGFEALSGDPQLVRTSVPEMVFGPSIGGLARHADRLTLVRGLSMDTLTHEVGRRRFLTGRPPVGLQAKGSNLATLLAAHLGQTNAIPQLSVRVESYNDAQPSYASAIRVSSVDDLLRALRPSPGALPATARARVDALLDSVADCPSSQRSAVLQGALELSSASRDLVGLGLGDRFDFGANTPEMEALRDAYGIDPENLRSAGAQAAAAVTALTSGIARAVNIEVCAGLDTHGPEWASAHGPTLQSGFDVVAAILDDLSSREYGTTGSSWLDHTTVVGFSEFGRSSLLNASGGRDHHLINAAFLAGGGLAGGRVLGRSSDLGLTPTTVNLATGAPDPDGVVLHPEHLFRAILQRVGIEDDVADLGVEPFGALYA